MTTLLSTPFARALGALAVVGALGLGTVACSSDDGDTSTGTTAGTTAATTAGKSHTEASEAELKQWQADLDAIGCWAGPVDGTMGPQTEAAIKEFQQAEGLTVDGLLGPQTEAALQKAAAEGKQVCKATTTTHGGGTTTTHGGGTTTTHGGGTTTTTAPTTTTTR